MWLYKSPIGNIYIKRLSNGRYGTIHNDVICESCSTPQSSADNVFMQCTGCAEWDSYDASNTDIPTDLSEWERL